MSVFKAYDIRGTYPDQLDETTAEAIGRALVKFLDAKTVVVTHDMRSMAPSMKDAFVRGAVSRGARVLDGGLASTPMNYFALGSGGWDAGVQVTASHNPAGYIGFKMSRKGGVPMSGDTGIKEIERLVAEGVEPAATPGSVERLEGLDARYRDHVLSFAGEIAPLTVAIDTANGMGGHEVPLVFGELPCEVVPLYFELDGTFPNHEANPLLAENRRDLVAAIREHGADLGIGFDGDADRSIFVDDAGEVVTPDLITTMIAERILRARGGGAIVYDLRSSRVLRERVEAAGGTAHRERVGHSFMKARMRAENAVFAGEFSGHYYFRENYFCDSGIIAAMYVLTIVSESGKKLSELAAPLRRYPGTGEINFEVEDKAGTMKALAERFADGRVDWLDGVTVEYDDWWFNVRASNTEPLLRLNLEANDAATFATARAAVLPLLGTPVDK